MTSPYSATAQAPSTPPAATAPPAAAAPPAATTPPATTTSPAAPGQPAASGPPGAGPQAGGPPTFTTKIEGTDNVYAFRYQGYQSMFVVTKAGVIATDPIGLRRPQAVATYINEIKKVTDQPIKYVIYSHSHYDHAAGGKPFKDLGAKFIAHKNAKAQLLKFPHPDVVMPDEVVDNKRTITLGGTTLELLYVGRNHSDNMLLMRLPKEKLIFAVDFIPVQTLPFRNMPDTASPVEWQDSLKRVLALDWDRMITGHPYAGGRLGTKQDVKDLIGYMDDISAEVKKAANEGKCIDAAMKDLKLPKYEKWGAYANYLPMNIERYCYLNNGG
jgi:glyoxylase-like metal-dependent hydrolase (beta-lactamase superfamily II)